MACRLALRYQNSLSTVLRTKSIWKDLLMWLQELNYSLAAQFTRLSCTKYDVQQGRVCIMVLPIP